jgi:predicted nuclease with TOPRIM domain
MLIKMDTNKEIDKDIQGRILSLEQKFRGINGRLSALEMRLSEGSSSFETPDNIEFIASEEPYVISSSHKDIESRLKAIEESIKDKGTVKVKKNRISSPYDIAALLTGSMLIIAGFLLYTGNIELIKNPLFVIVFGVAILACAVLKALS